VRCSVFDNHPQPSHGKQTRTQRALPCGSGVKYKRCCGRGTAAALRGFTSADRESALRKLGHFLEGPGWPEVIDDAEDLFWDYVDEPNAPTGEDAPILELMSQMVFEGWLFYDFQLEPGWHVVDAFLQAAPGLSLAERRYLRAMQSTCVHWRGPA